jgi:hypothetical protein
MGFHFYRRVHIFSGLAINVSRSGPSLTAGIRGAHLTINCRGVTRSAGIPGTGIYYTSRSGRYTGVHSAHRDGRGGVLLPLLLFLTVVIILVIVVALLCP